MQILYAVRSSITVLFLLSNSPDGDQRFVQDQGGSMDSEFDGFSDVSKLLPALDDEQPDFNSRCSGSP